MWENSIYLNSSSPYMYINQPKHTSVYTWIYEYVNQSLNLSTSPYYYRLLTYGQPFCRTIWIDVWFNKRRKITLCHITQRHLGQSEDWIFCVSLATSTCNVWRLSFPACWYVHYRKRVCGSWSSGSRVWHQGSSLGPDSAPCRDPGSMNTTRTSCLSRTKTNTWLVGITLKSFILVEHLISCISWVAQYTNLRSQRNTYSL